MAKYLKKILVFVLVHSLLVPPQAYAVLAKQIKIGKQGSFIIRTPNRNGKIVERIVTNATFHDIALDTNGDGTMDYWEHREGPLTVIAESPYRGHFMSLKLNERQATGTLEMDFLISEDRSKYRMITSRFVPYTIVKRELSNIVVGNECLDQYSETYSTADDWLKFLNEKVSKSDRESTMNELNCRLTRFQNFTFEKSCLDNPDFRDSLDDIKGGLANIIGSLYRSPSDSSKENESAGQRPTYLACLHNNGFATHAARIEAFFFGRITDNRNAAKAARGSDSNGSGADSSHPEWNSSCDPVALPKNFTPVNKYKMFRCDYVNRGSQEDDVEAGNFNYERQQITLMQKADECMGEYGYAKTIFHELLHASGMGKEDHPLVEAIETCCGDGLPESDPSCQKMKSLAEEKRIFSVYHGVMTQRFPEYEKIYAKLSEKAGDENARKIMSEYFKALNADASENQLARNECVQNSIGACDQTCRLKCENLYLDAVRKKTKDVFAQVCPDYITGKQDERERTCGEFSQNLQSMIQQKADSAIGGLCPLSPPKKSLLDRTSSLLSWPWLASILPNVFAEEISASTKDLPPPTCDGGMSTETAIASKPKQTPAVSSITNALASASDLVKNENATSAAALNSAVKSDAENTKKVINAPVEQAAIENSSAQSVTENEIREVISRGPVMAEDPRPILGTRDSYTPDEVAAVPTTPEIMSAAKKIVKLASPSVARAADREPTVSHGLRVGHSASNSVGERSVKTNIGNSEMQNPGKVEFRVPKNTIEIANVISFVEPKASASQASQQNPIQRGSTSHSGSSGRISVDGLNEEETQPKVSRKTASANGNLINAGQDPATTYQSKPTHKAAGVLELPSENGNSSSQNVAAKRTAPAFRSYRKFIRFLTGPYSEVEQSLRDTTSKSEVLKAASKYRIQVVDHQGTKWGVDAPSEIYIYCSKPKVKALVRNGCEEIQH